MNELITIVVPVYNVEKYIRKCLESIINQTYKNIEIILVDDGSIDNCGKICEEYKNKDNRITVIHKENGGLSDARNVGIDNSNGEYICFIDSDDYVTNDYVEYLHKLIIKYNCEISICAHKVVYDSGIIISNESDKEFVMSKLEAIERMLYYKEFDVSAWAKMYKMSLFKTGIRFPKKRLFEDAATTYKLMDKSKQISCGLQSKYFYMIRKNSIVTSEFSIKKLDLIYSTREMGRYLLERYPNLKNAVIRREVYANFSVLKDMLNSSKDYKKEEEEIIKFIKANRLNVLLNKNASIRDKLAILTLLFGKKFFVFSWNLYSKASKRI